MEGYKLIFRKGPDRHKKKVGIVFQGGALFDSMTVFENVAFPLHYCLGIKGEERCAMVAVMWNR